MEACPVHAVKNTSSSDSYKMVSFCGGVVLGILRGACEFHVETVDPSIETMHVYNMVGYYIV